MRTVLCSLVAVVLCQSSAARADRGALSVEFLSGVAVEQARLPASLGGATQVGSSASLDLLLSYALSSSLEVGALVLWEPSTDWVHPGAQASGFQGSLTSRSYRLGALGGVRLVTGRVWQASVGLGLGLSLRSRSSLNLYDVSGATPRSYGLPLADNTSTAFVFAPSAGVRWAGDHLTIGIEPRLELLADGPSWVITVPVTVSWSWYL